ncbi:MULTISPECIES: GntR family transcriptional regulator [Geobacillus]|jgi:GntR family transcriptional regulator|uniref:Probable transcriptional regulator n=1 Tax=Geobacillus thermodenitrificans (strain NG80-2) TaxID=420246 RepID=A4ITB7_GEOTN|nr:MULTISPECIES: GntR family transcriptional regulator [Geobacillus]ABO68571.1 Probable transcriptional regulator [Geobacillus thermodenitrificans NG80-2]NNU88777.1 GntR family transcriptional regulator [Geobacillus sp. MR]PTR46283.1 GntR family transcriptional regulator [Geobacillus thermodenitrificans]QNU32724.1 GntR family transcriptional regulator [Geobacillus sp. 47C-IIb]
MYIDKKLHIPLYRQVERVLEEKIKSDEWPIGHQLPTEQELADLFDVSTITVKRAILELVNKGYLYRQRGKGTFVSRPIKEQNLNVFFSLTTEDEKHPHRLVSFSVGRADREITNKLGIENDMTVIKIKRLKIEGNEPMALEYTYLPYDKCCGLTPDDINNELIYNILKKKFRIALGRAKLFIKPYIATDEKATLLQVEPGSPVFEWERFTYTKQEEVIEYSKFYVRQDKEAYYTEVYF